MIFEIKMTDEVFPVFSFYVEKIPYLILSQNALI